MNRSLKNISALLPAFLIWLGLSLAAAPAFALATPEETVKEIIGKLKESGDPAVIIEYVSWEDAFKETKPEVLGALGVTDAKGLKEKTKQLMAEPAKFVRGLLEPRIAALPPDKREIMSAQIEPLTKKVEKEFEEGKAKIKRTDFVIGKSEVTGETAIVEVKATLDGKTQENKLKLVKRGDKWLLPSSEFARSQPNTPGLAVAPAGGGPQMSVDPRLSGAPHPQVPNPQAPVQQAH